MSKGSKSRTRDREKYRQNYQRAFGKKGKTRGKGK